mgnify:CR=1 FL=1
MQKLIELDHRIFFFINGKMQNHFFDLVLPVVRNPKTWIPLYVALFIFLIWKFGKQGWLMILFAVINVGITDQLSAGILKPLVHRLRPCNNPALLMKVHSLIDCGAGYSMCSSHAANHFGLAIFFSVIFGKQYPWIIYASVAWAGVISLSQVYVGVHYPADITIGALIGIASGYGMGKLCLRFINKQNTAE